VTWSLGSGLDGRGVIVTGAVGAIGRPVAEAFAAAGARVLAVDVDEGAIAQVVESLNGSGHAGFACDLTDIARLPALIDAARTSVGGVHALVHLAGVLRRRSLSDVSSEDWDHQIDVNLKASFFLCRAAGQEMISAGRGGRIITFASNAWWTGSFGGAVVYAASKGGIVSMTRGLARTFGPHGITVNSIAPGEIDSPMLRTGLEPKVLEGMLAQIPLGRLGRPDEVAGTAVFLASEHASYISGATINISGGFLMY
jgi:NAD(P)-dependent dehydrogenase (short-subunit alcohol dehydrogenase family)